MGSYGARRRRREGLRWNRSPATCFGNLADIVLWVAREDPERIAVVRPRTAGGYGAPPVATPTPSCRPTPSRLHDGAARMGIAELTRIVFIFAP